MIYWNRTASNRISCDPLGSFGIHWRLETERLVVFPLTTYHRKNFIEKMNRNCVILDSPIILITCIST